DRIRYWSVTGVQTCALPICDRDQVWRRKAADLRYRSSATGGQTGSQATDAESVGLRGVGRFPSGGDTGCIAGGEVSRDGEVGLLCYNLPEALWGRVASCA